MKTLTLREIANAIESKAENICDQKVFGVSTDTRTLKKGDIYFALKGERFDGHDFISVAEKKGAVALVCSENVESNLPVLKVPSVLKALQKLASYYRNLLNVKIIAVTGSVGKTTTKNMIAEVLSSKYKVFSTDKNFNNEIGLPKSILSLDETYEFAVLEIGMNHSGEIKTLSKISCPDIAVITNIGRAHIGNLGSEKNILSAKLEILEGLKPGGMLILNSDDKFLKNVKNENFKTVFVGLDSLNKPDLYASNIRFQQDFTYFDLNFENKSFSAEIPSVENHNICNALFAAYIGLSLGISEEYVSQSFKNYSPSPMRSEISRVGGITIIKDYYNSSPDSAAVAIENLSNYKSCGKKIAVLGEIFELGDFSAEEHFKLAEICCKKQIDHVFFIGDDFQSFKSGMVKHSDCFKTNERKLFIDSLKNYIDSKKLNPGDTILIKGSRNMKMEEIYEFLKRYLTGGEYSSFSSSTTKLYVDVNAIKYNFAQIKHYAGKNVEVMPMVKANAYGVGSDIISNLFHNCKYLAVADIQEAKAIRKTLPKTNLVIIYQPSYDDIYEIVENDCIPAVSDLEFAKKLNEESIKQNKITRVHVEIDTGHARLGIDLKDTENFAKIISKLKNIEVEGLFMHYACADTPEDSDLEFTKLQTERFCKGIDLFENTYGKVKYKHACASPGMFNSNAKLFNMVRPGYIFYGYYPCDCKINLKPALKFTSKILQIREVDAGTPISYNRRYTTNRKSKIATVAIGYSDGIFRSLYKSGSFVVNGQKAPIVGTICMDLTMIDITDIIGKVNIGDEVCIFDNVNITVDEIAENCGTIGYEIISRIAEKAERIEIF